MRGKLGGVADDPVDWHSRKCDVQNVASTCSTIGGRGWPGTEQSSAAIYLLRIVSYAPILAAICDKNRFMETRADKPEPLWSQRLR
jgi:hypothetical protein